MHFILSRPSKSYKQTELCLKTEVRPMEMEFWLRAPPYTTALVWSAMCILECGNGGIRCADVLGNKCVLDGNLSVKIPPTRMGESDREKDTSLVSVTFFFHCSQPAFC